MSDNFTDKEIEEFCVDTIETLEGMKEAIEISIPKLEALLDGEITYEEYDEWVEENRETLEQMEI